MIMEALPKIICILGVTAAGKSNLALALAKKFNGEIISADSRQIYKELDIGTAKPTGHWLTVGQQRIYMVGTVSHHIIDFVDPKEDFTLSDYKILAIQKIDNVLSRGKIPFLVGGTALYLKAVLENWGLPQVPPDLVLRHKLEHQNSLLLYNELKQKDPEGASITGPHNKRRIIRALEVIYRTAKKFSEQRKKGPVLFDTLKLGLTVPKTELETKIINRTNNMIKSGLIGEVRRLSQYHAWNSPAMQSIGYHEFKDFFENKINLVKVQELITKNTLSYTRRQMTWFKKDKTINWVPADPKLALAQATSLVKDFLTAKQIF